MAVEGGGQGPAGSPRLRPRRAARQVFAAAAARSALEQAHVLGWLLLGLAATHAISRWTTQWNALVLLWYAATAGLGLLLVVWLRRPLRSATQATLLALVLAAGTLATLPLMYTPPPHGWWLVLGGFCVAIAITVAPALPALGLAAAWPVLALAWAAASGADTEPVAALWCTALAAAMGWRAQLQWRRQLLHGLDLSERLQVLQAERDAAMRKDSDKSRFLAIASHDLRQPVHALGLFAATLHKRLMRSPDEPLGRNLMRSVDALERSFNAMLDISRLDGSAMTPRLQSFPLRDLFRRLHMQYGGQAELAGLGLRFSPGGKSVTSDPQLLERILGNLVQNAIRYTTQGGIVVVARTTRTHVNIEVWDTGCGIAPENLPRVFDEFYQVGRGERDRSRGLGMGLAIVKRLAALLQHRLEVSSAPGRGTLFRLGVPLGELHGLDEETAAADTLPMQVDHAQMVLVVDDEEPIREGLRLLLQEWGYQVMTAADAAQAERAVNALEGRVDLILSDLHLGPGPGGQEVVVNVRRLCGREVPAILVTGDTTGAALRAVAAGADPVLFKPVQPRLLFEAMRAALEPSGAGMGTSP